jgi:hypothetical protein
VTAHHGDARSVDPETVGERGDDGLVARLFSSGASALNVSESVSQPMILPRDEPGMTLRLSVPNGVPE